MPKRKQFNAVGAYIYAGGFALGMRTKFNIVAHLEDGNFGVETFKLNFPKVPVYTDPTGWPLEALRAMGIHVVYCNPPCSPWSGASGKYASDADREAPLAKHTRNAFSLVEKLDPTIWVWESVSNAYTRERTMSDHLTGQAAEMGYAATHFLHDVKFMGLPQARRRLMTVFHKVKLEWPKTNQPLISVREALRGVKPGRLSDSAHSYDPKILHLTQPGEPMVKVWNRLYPGQKKGRPGFLHMRLHPDKPSYTITGSDTKIHPSQNRRMTAQELAVLCGYPVDYQWSAEGTQKYSELAKTVTPPAGRYMAAVFHAGLTRNEPVEEGEEWLVNYQAKSPRLDAVDRLDRVERLR